MKERDFIFKKLEKNNNKPTLTITTQQTEIPHYQRTE